MDRFNGYLEESHIEVIEGILEESCGSGEVPTLTNKSEVLRLLVDRGIESLAVESESDVDEDLLAELVPDHAIIEHRRDQRKKEAKPLFRGSKVAARFSQKADELFEGDRGERATPGVVEEIAESYIGELRDLEALDVLPERSVREQVSAIRARVETYREEYEAARYAPRDQEAPADVELGEDIRRLREVVEDVVLDIEARAGDEAFDPDAIIEAVAREYAVGTESIELLLEYIIPEDVDQRAALKDGSGVEFAEVIPAVETNPRELENSSQLPTFAGGSDPLRITAETSEDEEVVVDPEALRSRLPAEGDD